MPRPRPPKPWRPPADRPARVLLVRLSAVGDVLHALPALAALRAEVPGVRVDWAVEDRAADLLRGRDDLDRLLVLPRRALRAARGRPGRWLRAARPFVAALRAGAYDVAIDLQGNLKSGVVTRLARARLRFGLDRRAAREANHLFTTRRALPPASARHRVERGLALVGALLGRRVAWRPPCMPVDPEAALRAAALLAAAGAPGRGFVALHPGTSAFGAFKRWPPARHADVARRLVQAGAAVVVTASPDERALAEAATAGTGASLVVTPDLATLTEVLRGARLLVAADTGPLHLAALLDVPVVGLFGPKDPAVYGPYGRRGDGTVGPLPVVVRGDVACRPCRLRTCADPVCMTGLDPDLVLAAVQPGQASSGRDPGASSSTTP